MNGSLFLDYNNIYRTKKAKAFSALALSFAAFHTLDATYLTNQGPNNNLVKVTSGSLNGTYFLEAAITDGKTLSAANTAVAALYSTYSLATAQQTYDLLKAMDIAFNSYDVKDGWNAGDSIGFWSGPSYTLADKVQAAFGFTYADGTRFWTDPDNSTSTVTTRDIIAFRDTGYGLAWQQNEALPGDDSTAYLFIVADPVMAVPEPETYLTLGTSLLPAVAFANRRRRHREANASCLE